MDAVKGILQKDYDRTVIETLVSLRYRLKKFLKLYDTDEIDRVYQNLSAAKKALVRPVVPTDEELVRKWKDSYKGSRNTFPGQGVYLTEGGEKVRSKSEKILADIFRKNGIPYSYEPEFRLKDGSHLFPDFALLNLKTGKTVYWEHFGLVSEGEYAIRTLQKLDLYEKNGLMAGRDLLYSMESEGAPLDISQIEQKIREFLL